jgi:hypothetical protein
MAYREVRMMDIDQVIRRWLGGEKIRGIARSTGCYSAPKAHQENLENCAKLLEMARRRGG